MMLYRAKITNRDDLVVVLVGALERDNRVGVVVVVDPVKALPAGVALIERAVFQIEFVQAAEEVLQLAVLVLLEQVPEHRHAVVPFDDLTGNALRSENLSFWLPGMRESSVP